jgi:K+-sensing histidine kinase KdpD
MTDEDHLTPAWLRYAPALILSGLVTLLMVSLPWTVSKPGILLLNLLAVMISAYLGGFGPGVLATALGVLGATYFLLPPLYSLRIHARSDLIFVGIFATAALIAAWFLDWANAPSRE